MENLDHQKRSLYIRYVKEVIIDQCKRMKLPLFVQSTAIYFWCRCTKYNIHKIISLACKANDKHVDMGICDMDLAEEMEYDFHRPSPYLRMYGLIIILQEKSIIKCDNKEENSKETNKDGEEIVLVDIKSIWEKGVANMEKVLLSEIKAGVNEMAIAALCLPSEMFKNIFQVDWAVIEALKKEISAMKPLDRKLAWKQLSNTDIEKIVK